MEKTKAIFALFVLVLVCTQVSAQRSISTLFYKNEQRGDKMFEDLYFEHALKYYTLAYEKNGSKSTMLKVAESYRMLGDFRSAAKWYKDGLESPDVPIEPFYKYHYADVLLSFGELAEARKWFVQYQEEVPEDSRTSRKIYGIDHYSEFKKDSLIVTMKSAGINTEYSDFGVFAAPKGLVFSSARGKSSFVDPDYLRDEDLQDLYFTTFSPTDGWGPVKDFSKDVNSLFHEGTGTFYNSGDRFIFTRSNLNDRKKAIKAEDGKTKLQLVEARKTTSGWTLTKLAINQNDFSMAHPSLNQTNDTLYFSSDIPGGFGGSDLYFSTLVDGEWGNITNLGAVVNTEGDEMYPFIKQNRLFFSSTGHEGLGGFDVYKGYIENSEVKTAVNMGYPLNSNADDFAFSIDPERMAGYISSNRDNGKGSDDIYGYSINYYVLAGVVEQDEGSEPIANARVLLKRNGKTVAETVSDENGMFRFDVSFNRNYEIEAYSHKAFDYKASFTVPGNALDLDTFRVKMDEMDLFVRGVVYDNQTQGPLNEAHVFLHNLTEHWIDSLTTGVDGTFEFPIRPDQQFILGASKYHFFADSIAFASTGIEKGEIQNDLILDEEYVDKEVIYFDYNEFVLQNEARPILDKVVRIMKQYPKDYLIIAAHADARGTVEDNQILSDQRALVTYKYMLSRGIKKSRIIYRGFGEAFIINRCTDGANCEEEDHSKNRRTELTIESYLAEEEREFLKN